MDYLKTSAAFDSAHFLSGYQGKCSNLHAHALIYEEHSLHSTTVEALLAEGFHLIAVPFRPTAEEFAKHFYQKLQEQGMPVHRVTVYETPDNCASDEV